MKKLLDGVSAVGSSQVVDLGVAGNIAFVHVWSAATSTASVQIEASNDPSQGEPWAPATNSVGTAIAAITNPGNPGTFTQVAGRFVRVTVSSWASGVIFATAEPRIV